MGLHTWYLVEFDSERIRISVHPPEGTAWEQEIPWQKIERICFEAADFLESDKIYLFVHGRSASYAIPTEAMGGLAFWNAIIQRGLFDANVAIEAAISTGKIFCWPPPDNTI